MCTFSWGQACQLAWLAFLQLSSPGNSKICGKVYSFQELSVFGQVLQVTLKVALETWGPCSLILRLGLRQVLLLYSQIQPSAHTQILLLSAGAAYILKIQHLSPLHEGQHLAKAPSWPVIQWNSLLFSLAKLFACDSSLVLVLKT